MLTEQEMKIIEELKWSKERAVSSIQSVKIVKSARVPLRHKFWKIWKSKKNEMKSAGFSVFKHDLDFHVKHEMEGCGFLNFNKSLNKLK